VRTGTFLSYFVKTETDGYQIIQYPPTLEPASSWNPNHVWGEMWTHLLTSVGWVVHKIPWLCLHLSFLVKLGTFSWLHNMLVPTKFSIILGCWWVAKTRHNLVLNWLWHLFLKNNIETRSLGMWNYIRD
jgi:hypothetical protein